MSTLQRTKTNEAPKQNEKWSQLSSQMTPQSLTDLPPTGPRPSESREFLNPPAESTDPNEFASLDDNQRFLTPNESRSHNQIFAESKDEMRSHIKSALQALADDSQHITSLTSKLSQECFQLESEFAFLESKITAIVKSIMEDFKKNLKGLLTLQTKMTDQFLQNCYAKKSILKKIDGALGHKSSLNQNFLSQTEGLLDQVFSMVESQKFVADIISGISMDDKIAYFLRNTGSFTQSMRLVFNEIFKIDGEDQLREHYELLKSNKSFLSLIEEKTEQAMNLSLSKTTQRSPVLSGSQLNRVQTNPQLPYPENIGLESGSNQRNRNRSYFERIKASFDLANCDMMVSPGYTSLIWDRKLTGSILPSKSETPKPSIQAPPNTVPNNSTAPLVVAPEQGQSDVYASFHLPEKEAVFHSKKNSRDEKLKNVFHKILASNELQIINHPQATAQKKNVNDNSKNTEKDKAERILTVNATNGRSSQSKIFNSVIPSKQKEKPKVLEDTKTITATVNRSKIIQANHTAKNEKTTESKVTSQSSMKQLKPFVAEEIRNNRKIKESSMIETRQTAKRESQLEKSVKKQASSQDIRRHTFGHTERFISNNNTKNIYEWTAVRYNAMSQQEFKS